MAVMNGKVTAPPEAETVEQARERLARERHAAEAFAERYGLEFVDMTRFRIDNDLFRRIPFDLMLRYQFIPEAQHDGSLSVVMAERVAQSATRHADQGGAAHAEQEIPPGDTG